MAASFENPNETPLERAQRRYDGLKQYVRSEARDVAVARREGWAGLPRMVQALDGLKAELAKRKDELDTAKLARRCLEEAAAEINIELPYDLEPSAEKTLCVVHEAGDCLAGCAYAYSDGEDFAPDFLAAIDQDGHVSLLPQTDKARVYFANEKSWHGADAVAADGGLFVENRMWPEHAEMLASDGYSIADRVHRFAEGDLVKHVDSTDDPDDVVVVSEITWRRSGGVLYPTYTLVARSDSFGCPCENVDCTFDIVKA